jgi:hypothetical protein
LRLPPMDISLRKLERAHFSVFQSAHRHDETLCLRLIATVEYVRSVRCNWSFYPGGRPILFPRAATIPPPEIRGASLKAPAKFSREACHGDSYWLQGGTLWSSLSFGITLPMPQQKLPPVSIEQHLRSHEFLHCTFAESSPKSGLYRGHEHCITSRKTIALVIPWMWGVIGQENKPTEFQ